VTIYAHIRNNGGIVDASGVRTANIEVVFIIDGNQYGSTQIIESLYYGEEILIYTHWNPVRGEDSNDEISIIVAVDPHDYIGEADNSNNEGKGSYIVKEYQTTPGIEGGEVIGYDISLARSVTGSWIASEDGSGVWTVQNVKFQPQISIDLVHWHLIDEQGKNVSDGITSHIYGYYPGNGKSVVFIDNDLNCMLSPGDKFVVYPGEADSDLANISDIADYQMRFMTKDSPAPEEEIVDKESKEEEVEEIVDKESEEEEVEVPAISLIAAIAVLGTVVIFRRK
jgi:hypothetical protein